jgi:hypothetical protein
MRDVEGTVDEVTNEIAGRDPTVTYMTSSGLRNWPETLKRTGNSGKSMRGLSVKSI